MENYLRSQILSPLIALTLSVIAKVFADPARTRELLVNYSTYQKRDKTSDGNIRIFIQEPSHIVPLQIIDYIIWAVYRVYSNISPG